MGPSFLWGSPGICSLTMPSANNNATPLPAFRKLGVGVSIGS
jgi:hypothetical protein